MRVSIRLIYPRHDAFPIRASKKTTNRIITITISNDLPGFRRTIPNTTRRREVQSTTTIAVAIWWTMELQWRSHDTAMPAASLVGLQMDRTGETTANRIINRSSKTMDLNIKPIRHMCRVCWAMATNSNRFSCRCFMIQVKFACSISKFWKFCIVKSPIPFVLMICFIFLETHEGYAYPPANQPMTSRAPGPTPVASPCDQLPDHNEPLNATYYNQSATYMYPQAGAPIPPPYVCSIDSPSNSTFFRFKETNLWYLFCRTIGILPRIWPHRHRWTLVTRAASQATPITTSRIHLNESINLYSRFIMYYF